jgi:hypothetical protein
VPYLLGLAGAAAAFLTARHTDRAAAPLAAPAAVLAAAFAFGTGRITDWPVTGAAFAAGLLAWAAARSRRSGAASGARTATPAARTARRLRLAAGAGVLLAAVAAAALLEPALPGASGFGRAALRDAVTPPLDLRDYPSPLAGFHKYTEDAHQLYGQTLMTVTGLPAGQPVVFAVLDDYDGSVWGAVNPQQGDVFEHAGSALPAEPGAPAPTGPRVTVRITVDAAYALPADTGVWVPTAGAVSSIGFSGPGSAAAAGSLWYDAATGSALATDRLQAGDTVTLQTAAATTALPANAQPYGEPELSDGYQQLFAARAAVWDKGATGFTAQLKAIAQYLKQDGAYSDGGPGEGQYLPGHDIGRLTEFLDGSQPVGDDEQYAAAYALLASSIGMPARVVLGATPERGGIVRGSDVHAWVQVRLADGAWATVPSSLFVPPTTKAPQPQPPQMQQDSATVVVPPPDPLRPPASAALGGQSTSGTSAGPLRPPGPTPWWISALIGVLLWGGTPVGAVAAVYGGIAGAKAYRRHRRRTRGSPADRYSAGWRDLADHARDLGTALPAGLTRRQQARRLPGPDAVRLAAAADAAVYGAGDPLAEPAAGYWREIDAARAALTRAAGRARRLRAAFAVRTLAPAVPRRGGSR